jgi:hypothetical protein
VTAYMNVSTRKASIIQDIKDSANSDYNTSRRRLTNSTMNCRAKGGVIAYNKGMHSDFIPLSFVAGSAPS